MAETMSKIARVKNFKSDSVKSFIKKRIPDIDVEEIFKKVKKEEDQAEGNFTATAT